MTLHFQCCRVHYTFIMIYCFFVISHKYSDFVVPIPQWKSFQLFRNILINKTELSYVFLKLLFF